MAAGKYDMYIEQGTDYSLLVTLKDDNNALINLTGHAFRGKIRKTASSPTVIAEFSFEVLDQGTNTGEFKVKLDDAVSSAIALDPSENPERTTTFFCYDIESELAGTVTRWLEGTVEMSPELTK